MQLFPWPDNSFEDRGAVRIWASMMIPEVFPIAYMY